MIRLENFIYALSIPKVGFKASKGLADYIRDECNGDILLFLYRISTDNFKVDSK